MTYLLLAWSQGNCAGKARLPRRSCPYLAGPMRDAWLKGYDAGSVASAGHHQQQTRYQRAAA